VNQAGITWHRSSRCESGTCVEIAHVDGTFLVRDSKRPDGGALRLSRAEWEAFRTAVRSGDFG
jgi:hypothetical protein